MIRFLLRTFIFVVILSIPTHSFGAVAGDTFIISSFVGDDFEPPTTPVLQTAIPVAPTQINLTWLPATDNVFLLGYRVYRDGVPIATTTLTTFSDTGLTPSTTYSYTVDAYDSYSNVSSSSNAIATSTPAIPAPPPVATSTGGTQASAIPTLRSIDITPEQRSALIAWQTYGPTRYTITWGRTTSYELGSVSSNVFSQSHESRVIDLEPGTTYYFSLVATDGRGVTRTLATDSFTTLPQINATIPVNVQQFIGEVRQDDVVLRWVNPVLPPGAVVRIVRSHLAYPESIQDGALVYEGRAETVTDAQALRDRSPQFYTAFVITADGLVSSGAIVRVAKGADTALAPTSPSEPTAPPEPTYQESGDPIILRASDIQIVQGNLVWRMDTPLNLAADSMTLIRIPVTAVAPNLKSIIVSLENPTDQRQVSSYLLKRNQVGDAYEAVLAPVGVVGQARLTIEVFDYNLQTVRRVSTIVTFTKDVLPSDVQSALLSVRFWLMIGLVIGILTAGFWLIAFRRRRKKDEDNH